jgi:hypothetical protein
MNTPLTPLRATLRPLHSMAIIGLLAASLAGCGEKVTAAKEAATATAEAVKAASQMDAKKLEEASKKMDEAGKKMDAAQKSGDAQAMGDAMKAMSGAMAGATGETVDFREMRALLPESIAGLKRIAVEGSKSNTMGIAASVAKATYESEGEGPKKRIRVEMTDIAGLGAMAAMAFAWANVEIDKETQNGYEKTTTINGHRAMEKFDKAGKRGELDVMVANRFIVKMESENLDMDAFKSGVSAIDLKKLAALKPAAPAVAAK